MSMTETRLLVYRRRLILVAMLIATGCKQASPPTPGTENATDTTSIAVPQFRFTSPEHQLGTHFDPASDRFRRPPQITEIALPDRPGAHAIWGSTGRDDSGRIYFGVASYGIDNPSAYLLRYNPKDATVVPLGDVNSQLDALGVRRFEDYAETQMKIHSKACQAADGQIYFSSQDEHDEAGDGSKNVKFGGRLLRLNPTNDQWETVLATPQALIATATTGRYVYSLGYFGNVLYQFDTQTSQINSKTIGTYGGHVTRNFLVDRREHAFVPRVRAADTEDTGPGISTYLGNRLKSELVELDESLNEVATFPLADYEPTADTESHGITAFCNLSTGDIAFLSHTGSLTLVTPGDSDKPTQLKQLGWFHPSGKAYSASLFCPTGSRFLYGFVAKNGYEWVEYDVETAASKVVPLDDASAKLLKTEGLLVYGCNTLDDQSCGFVVGWKKIARGYGPFAFRVCW
jgi:hypothetical protein